MLGLAKFSCHTPFLKKLLEDVLPRNESVNQESGEQRIQENSTCNTGERQRLPQKTQSTGVLGPQVCIRPSTAIRLDWAQDVGLRDGQEVPEVFIMLTRTL